MNKMTWNTVSGRVQQTACGVWMLTQMRQSCYRLTHIEGSPMPAGDYATESEAKEWAEKLSALLEQSGK